MTQIFDKITSDLPPALQQVVKVAERSEFCADHRPDRKSEEAAE